MGAKLRKRAWCLCPLLVSSCLYGVFLCHTYRSPEAQQRVGGCFLSLMPQMRTLYLAYCANHPSAVGVLTEHRFVGCDIWALREVDSSAPLDTAWNSVHTKQGHIDFALKLSV